jgi:hypothetical protein
MAPARPNDDSRWTIGIVNFHGSCGGGPPGISDEDAVGHGIVSGPPSGVFSAGS